MQLSAHRSRLVVTVAVIVAVLAALVSPLAGTSVANHPASCLDLTPETASNSPNTLHQITATLRTNAAPCNGAAVLADNGAVQIDFEMSGANDQDDGYFPGVPDFTCSIPQGSSACAISYTGTLTGTDTIRGWVDHDQSNATDDVDDTEGRDEATTAGATAEPDTTDVVEKIYQAVGAASRLDCTPETDTNPTNTAHVVTCTARNSSNAVVSNVRVDVEATGTNDPDGNAVFTNPDFSCTTAADGTCTVTHPSNESAATGTTTYRGWIDTDNDNSTVEADQTEGRDAVATPGAEAEEDDTDVVEKTWDPNLVATRLDCTPETATNNSGTAHTVTCTARNNADATVANIPVDVEATGANDPDNQNSRTSPDFSCTTGGNGTCSIIHGPGGIGTTTGAGTTTYRAWIDQDNSNATDEADSTEARDAAVDDGQTAEPDDTDVMEKTWVNPNVPTRLDCTPETATNATGSSHTVTCTATNDQNAVQSGARVDVEATGANDPDNANSATSPDFTCTTAANGTCAITHSSQTSTAGTTTYRAWIDIDNNNTTSEADATEGRDSSTTPGATAEPDDTDVVEKTWLQPTRLDCDPETDTNSVGEAHQITCTARTSSDLTVVGVAIDIESTGTNDPDGNSTLTSPDFSCTTASNGSCTVTHSSSQTSTAGTTTYRAWIDIDNSNSTSEADATEGQNSGTAPGATAEPDNTNVLEKTWLAARARTIDCEPETASAAVGSQQTVTCTVRDRLGAAVAGEGVTFTSSGTGALGTTTQTTNAQGQASAIATSNQTGTQSITGTLTDDVTGAEPAEVDDCDKSANDPAGAPAGVCSDMVTRTWTAGAAASVVVSPEEEINQPGGSTVLTATVLDALGNPVQGATVVWSISGQGAVATTQPTTDASGKSTATVTSDEVGNSLVTATVSPCATGGDCDDTATVHWGPATCDVFGTEGSDVLEGGAAGEKICGFGGNDFLSGGGGNDILKAGEGRDVLQGGDGRDVLNAGDGRDVLRGGDGPDTLKGGGGNDSLNGQGDRDECRGGPGKDAKQNCED